MKLKVFIVLFLLCFGILSLTSCGTEGPQGEQGIQGENGQDGIGIEDKIRSSIRNNFDVGVCLEKYKNDKRAA